MEVVGKIVNVTTLRVGTALVTDHAAGTTALTVFDGYEFDEDGGLLELGDALLAYLGWTTDEEEPGQPDTILLASPLTGDYEAGTRAAVWPTSKETIAAVVIDETGEALEVTVPQGLVPTLRDGIRGDNGETVTVADVDGSGWQIVSVEKDEVLVDGSNIDPDTLPTPAPVAPTYTPELTATGGPGCVALAWSAVNPAPTAVVYDVHDVTLTGDEITDETLVQTTASTGYLVAPVDGTHRYRLWARSGDQYAPAPSEAVTGTPTADATSIIVANAVFAKDGIHVGQSNGPGHDLDVNGWLLRTAGGLLRAKFPTDEDEELFARGRFELETARAEKFVLAGRDNIIDRGGRLVLSAKITAPDRLQLTPVWPEIRYADGLTLPFFMNAEHGNIRRATCYASSGTTRKFYAVGDSGSGGRAIDLTVDLATNQITGLTAAGAVGSALQGDAGIDSMTFCNGSIWTMSTGDQRVYRYNPTTGARTGSFNRPWSGDPQGIYAQGTTLKFWRWTNGQISTWTINQADGTLTATTGWAHPSSRGIPSRMQRGVFDDPSGTAQHVVFQDTSPRFKARSYAADGTSRGEWLQAPTQAYLWDLAWTNPDASGAGEWISFGEYDVSLHGTRVAWRHDGAGQVTGDYADRQYVGIGGVWARNADQTYHTTLSDTAYQYVPRTARLSITWAPWPVLSDPPAATDVDRLFVYTYALGSSSALDEIAHVTDRSTQTTTVQAWAYTGPAEKTEADFAENTFPDLGGAGQIASSAGGFEANGDGTGRWDLMTRPKLRRSRTGAHPVADGASSTVWLNLNTSVITDGAWTYADSAPFGMTCQIAGFYWFLYSVTWASNTNGRRSLVPYVNGSATVERADMAPGGSYGLGQQAVFAAAFVPGDVVAARLIQTSGGSLDVTGATLSILKASA